MARGGDVSDRSCGDVVDGEGASVELTVELAVEVVACNIESACSTVRSRNQLVLQKPPWVTSSVVPCALTTRNTKGSVTSFSTVETSHWYQLTAWFAGCSISEQGPMAFGLGSSSLASWMEFATLPLW